jgi:hypothetical protein
MKKNKEKQQSSWGVAQVWNETHQSEKSVGKVRDYISAGDIGKPLLDTYLKMKGITPTNDFDDRVLRIFEAGNEFHWLMRKLFERIGILIDCEQYVEVPATDETVKVLGYYDLRIGGRVNLAQAEKAIKEQEFSPFVEGKAIEIARAFEKKYPKGFKPVICEVKSINSMAFWSKKNFIGQGYEHHRLQLYTYLKAMEYQRGVLLYISKDDLTLEECLMYHPNEPLEKIWQKNVKDISYYYLNNIEPPKEDDMVFNKGKKKWELNWKVGRSPYLTKITGFKDQKEWESKYRIELKEKNKEFKRSIKK